MTKHTVLQIPELRVLIQDVKLSEIDIPEDRARDFDPAEAEALAPIIAMQGLQHPIRIRSHGNRFMLVAGLRRLEAVRLNEWQSIPATVSTADNDADARIEEVMENLARHELKVLDRCHHLYELKQAYERLYPAMKHGGDRKSEIKSPNWALDPEQPEIFGFARATAEKFGISQTAIKLAVKIWKDLSVASRTRCAGTWLADHQAGLKQLAEQTPVNQAKVLDLLFSEPPKATNVPDALTIIENGRVLTHDERKFAAVNKALSKMPEKALNSVVEAQAGRIDARLAEMKKSIAVLSKFFADLQDDELDNVVADHEERIIASLKRRGRI
ncbi:ParB/RepB/Spo0J family partition protein [Rhizobium herbae]|uniref:ParB family chromosome partitioning protein n=1 Tax=Rhizobium herbae TaxID=508661 RepID=A0ABS4EW84_9HYPH|nr:ParB N-terminal domain-containing protein [Rhizobium herbae]MBP1862173.1 ParB family chromosome partitioning protein [Rhizobium herbae]